MTVRGMRRETTSKGRFYYWGSEQFHSVTTIISGGLPKPVLVNWAKKFTAEYAVNNFPQLSVLVKQDPKGAVDWLKGAAYRDRDAKADIGTAVHAAIEAQTLGRPVEVGETEKPYVAQFEAFLNRYRPTFEASEMTVFNRSQVYAGTLDAIVVIGGRRLLVDWKTARSGIWPEVGLQLAAYRRAEFIGAPDGTEEPMPEVDGCAALWLRPDGFDFVEVRTDDDVYRAFLFCREVFRFAEVISKTVIGGLVPIPDEALTAQLEDSLAATGEDA